VITETRYYCAEQYIPYANLAAEAYLLETVPAGCCILYLWQNKHTVVIGRNQNSWQECKVRELAADGGYLVRRLSGGGAVFHDLGNLNFTFLVRREDYDVDRQLEVILRAVRMLGIAAEKSGRNDITIDGRKFSGNAFYEQAGHCYHHGTLLLHVDMQNLSRYLNVSGEKLRSKGVDSVRARVVNLADYCPEVTAALMKEKLIAAFAEVYGQPPQKIETEKLDRERIETLRARFSSWEWIYGPKIPFTFEAERRFAWGNILVQLQVNRGRVEQAAVYSDAMEADLISQIRLAGCAFSSRDLSARVESLRRPGNTAVNGMIEDICQFLREQDF
jgi:lipoate-protein ligase A